MKAGKFNIGRSIYLIIILAALLRVWRLDVNPPHLSPDEASLGYNAYTILKTGRDEYGKSLPIIFKSFGDYKPGFYVYLTVPFIAILGLNEWSVRLPSAIAGILSIYLIYLIVDKLTEKKSNIFVFKSLSLSVGEIAAFLLAFSPWHIHFSRGAWEVNIALTLTLIGIYFFLRALNKPILFFLASVFFALSFITYQGAKLSTTLIMLCLVAVYFKEIIIKLKSVKFIIAGSVIVFMVITSPILVSIFKGQTGRLEVFSIFSYPRSKEKIENLLTQNREKTSDLTYIIYHSEPLNFTRVIIGKYFNHFSGRFLFFEGDYQNPKHSSPNSGMLMLFDILLLPIGFVYLILQKGRTKKFVFIWLILSPLPAILTRDMVQAVRAYNMVIPLTLISSFGLAGLLDKLNNYCYTKHSKESPAIIHTGYKTLNSILFKMFFISLFLSFFISIIYFLDSYFIHMPVHDARYWNYGYKQVITKLLPIQNNYKNIYFQQSYDQPYIYYLFYSKYDPKTYQRQANLSYYLGPDVGLVEKLDNITFKGWSWPYATGFDSTLIIGNDVAIPSDFNTADYNLISEIKFPDNFMTAFRIVETK